MNTFQRFVAHTKALIEGKDKIDGAHFTIDRDPERPDEVRVTIKTVPDGSYMTVYLDHSAANYAGMTLVAASHAARLGSPAKEYEEPTS